MIATTSYDDYVRILSFGRNALQAAAAGGNTKAKAASQEEGATATRLVVHNNQTGMYACACECVRGRVHVRAIVGAIPPCG